MCVYVNPKLLIYLRAPDPLSTLVTRSLFSISVNLFCTVCILISWGLFTRVNTKQATPMTSVLLLFSHSGVPKSFRSHGLQDARLHCSSRLTESAQTHVHWVGDAIQPSHPLSSPSPLALNVSQHQGLFTWVGSSHQVTKVLELQLQHQSFQWIFRVDFLQDGLLWSPCCPSNSQESSPTPQSESISSSALSLLYGPVLTSIHDYWKNHSFDYMDLCLQSLCFLICCLGWS